jgi:hypothetical protein
MSVLSAFCPMEIFLAIWPFLQVRLITRKRV